MKLYKLFLPLFFFSIFVNAQDVAADDTNYANKYVIGAWGCGFFSDFLGVLNNLLWCEIQNNTPVVYWNSKSRYHISGGLNGKTNVWEYYFEPVSELFYTTGDKLHTNYWVSGSGLAKKRLFFYRNIGAAKRKKAKELIDKYVAIRPCVQEKIDAFYNEYMQGKKTIGLHIRGTDKHTEEKRVSLLAFLAEAQKYEGYQFLIATDEFSILEKAKKGLKGNVIFYDAQRSSNGKPVHRKFNKAKLGEEVLIEVQLLSRCDKLIHTYSNVSTAALYFNPDLENTLLRCK